MSTKLKTYFSSISVKLFLWFWLVTLLSIIGTRLISTQFSDNGFIVPPHPEDVHRLGRLVHRFEQMPGASIDYFLQQHSRFEHHSVWIKDPQSKQILSEQKQHLPELAKYLVANSFSELFSVQFPSVRLTGPISLTVNNKLYQVFIASRTKQPPFGLFMLSLPRWARIGIPLLISFALCWLLAKSLSRPLANIQQAAKLLGEGNFSTRVAKVDNRTDELGQLARSFNQMAGKLERSLSAQQRLLGDVSHELRSPMTRLQLALALAQKSANEPDALQKYLLRCETEVAKLDNMIASVLNLSRLENALHHIDSQPFDLLAFIKIIRDDAQFLADQKQISIKIEASTSPTINADQQLLASALSNVLNNAVKYAPENSEITITINQQQSGEIVLSISDQGQGVPDSELSQLFEPFYRVNGSRERSTGGTGLGLAIARQAILAHQGSITARNGASGGLQVIITLPQQD